MEHAISLESFSIEAYDDVHALWQACEGIGLSDADSRNNIAQFLARNPGLSFIAVDGARIVGAILAGHDGRRGYLHHLAVHPDYRRQGIGQSLAQEALDALRQQGIAKCHGFVFRDNTDALEFWRNTGWTIRDDVAMISRGLSDS